MKEYKKYRKRKIKKWKKERKKKGKNSKTTKYIMKFILHERWIENLLMNLKLGPFWLHDCSLARACPAVGHRGHILCYNKIFCLKWLNITSFTFVHSSEMDESYDYIRLDWISLLLTYMIYLKFTITLILPPSCLLHFVLGNADLFCHCSALLDTPLLSPTYNKNIFAI